MNVTFLIVSMPPVKLTVCGVDVKHRRRHRRHLPALSQILRAFSKLMRVRL